MRPLTRRILIGAVALVAALYYLLERLPVDRGEFFGYIGSIVIGVGALVACAFIAAVGLHWLRKYRRGGS
ncbi:MAG: hypothetical protein AAF515_03700 [Pseudomonadota bacterium]